jgi:hypothetical protein
MKDAILFSVSSMRENAELAGRNKALTGIDPNAGNSGKISWTAAERPRRT